MQEGPSGDLFERLQDPPDEAQATPPALSGPPLHAEPWRSTGPACDDPRTPCRSARTRRLPSTRTRADRARRSEALRYPEWRTRAGSAADLPAGFPGRMGACTHDGGKAHLACCRPFGPVWRGDHEQRNERARRRRSVQRPGRGAGCDRDRFEGPANRLPRPGGAHDAVAAGAVGVRSARARGPGGCSSGGSLRRFLQSAVGVCGCTACSDAKRSRRSS